MTLVYIFLGIVTLAVAFSLGHTIGSARAFGRAYKIYRETLSDLSDSYQAELDKLKAGKQSEESQPHG